MSLCERCGNVFDGENWYPPKKYCTYRCSNNARARRRSARLRKEDLAQNPSVSLRCKECGDYFIHLRAGSRRRPVFCSDRCRIASLLDRQSERRPPKKRPRVTACMRCGLPVVRRRYCSAKCRVKYERDKHRARSRSIPLNCSGCGKTFMGDKIKKRQRDNGKAVYCGIKCWNDFRRAYYSTPEAIEEKKRKESRKKSRWEANQKFQTLFWKGKAAIRKLKQRIKHHDRQASPGRNPGSK